MHWAASSAMWTGVIRCLRSFNMASVDQIAACFPGAFTHRSVPWSKATSWLSLRLRLLILWLPSWHSHWCPPRWMFCRVSGMQTPGNTSPQSHSRCTSYFFSIPPQAPDTWLPFSHRPRPCTLLKALLIPGCSIGWWILRQWPCQASALMMLFGLEALTAFLSPLPYASQW